MTRRTARPAPLATAVLAAVLGLSLLGGCTSLPDSGPIVDADPDGVSDVASAPDITAVGPADNATGVEVATGFLDVMTASPTRIDVAKEFLSASAADAWDPEASTIIYADKLPPSDEVTRVSIPLVGADRIDRAGGWQGPLPADEQELRLDLTIENGEYRITNPPDALIVPQPWFTQRFRPTALFFFDPSGQILVPEPVYLPRGEQLATSLITGLLRGPGPGLGDVVRSYLPKGLTLRLSVPVSDDGVADIQLDGTAVPSPPEVEKMLAQLAWTLRAEPAISAFRVSIGDIVLESADGSSQFSVDAADAFDPAVAGASTEIYGVRDGVVVERDGNQLRPLPGPLGQATADVRAAAVSLDATQVAAVSGSGTTLVRASTGPGAARAGEVEEVVAGEDLLAPAWDFTGRIWSVDRTADGAVVRVVGGRRARVVDVPGISGTTVRAFLISRDGTRLAAVVRGARGDQLRIGRVAVDDLGVPTRVATTTSLTADAGLPLRIVDLAWTSPTTLAVLTPVVPGESFEIRTVSVDGSPSSPDGFSTTVSARLVGLVGSESVAVPTFGATRTGLVDLLTGSSYGFQGDPPTALRYAG